MLPLSSYSYEKSKVLEPDGSSDSPQVHSLRQKIKLVTCVVLLAMRGTELVHIIPSYIFSHKMAGYLQGVLFVKMLIDSQLRPDKLYSLLRLCTATLLP